MVKNNPHLGTFLLAPQDDMHVGGMQQGATISGLALFAAMFFAGAGEPDPYCNGPPPPWWIKFIVGLVVGTFKGGIIAVLILLFKSEAAMADWDDAARQRQLARWRRSECSLACIAFGYMFISFFFVFAFVIILDDKGFARFRTGMITCYTVALVLKPLRVVVNDLAVLLLVREGRYSRRRGRQRTWPEIKAELFVAINKPALTNYGRHPRWMGNWKAVKTPAFVVPSRWELAIVPSKEAIVPSTTVAFEEERGEEMATATAKAA
jgi:hypothetical protein